MSLSVEWGYCRFVCGVAMLNLTEYAGLLAFLFFGVAFVGGVFALNYLVRERGMDPLRKSIYECGMETIGTPYVSPNIRFYVFALVFVIFDIEAVFLLPWAVRFKELGMVGFIEMIVFIAILFVAFVVAWRKGALKWE
ncbi:MAG: NAD(P)H-quinone oxidoreductase subunit 3 [Elusimicrobia bacterium]|nr:NAD(P)H-quinone oxidoreductase subunit 3 [Elusimicrobiota bacterium]